MPTARHLDELAALTGAEIGVSSWVRIDQDVIDRFAAATGDDQWIHTDPARAAATEIGATIAHGLLTLSLIPRLTAEVVRFDGVTSRINYGYDRVRFPQPLVVGSRIRDRIVLDAVTPTPTGARVVTTHTVEIEGEERPSCVATSVTLLVATSAPASERGIG